MSEGERETLAIALDHAWRWYENRRSRTVALLQVVTLWLAILGAGYGAVLQAKLYTLGGAIGILAAVGLVAADREATRVRASAALAADAVAELEARLADATGVQALRLYQRECESNPPSRRFLGLDLGRWVVYVSLATCIAAATYTWVGLA
ncbi:hypothetical protein [Streptomyces coeruleofuscus]|uniref:SLATT domain-containing protein n=1 Tax=Streptomyces coeruleofuscus TaxID=66879 RepID=A0ABN3JB40_9ACTN